MNNRLKTKKLWKIPFLLLLVLLTKSSIVFGQIEVEPAITEPFSPKSLIQNVFLGDGIQVTNIQFNGAPRALGYFSNGMDDIGFEEGLVLTTGEAFRVDEPSSSASTETIGNDVISAELAAISESELKDALEYIITFIPTTDSIEFKYRFASEEYPEYGCDCFHDVFGFYIYGPGVDPSGENLAVLPGTDLPVSVKTIHPFDTDPTNGAGCPPQPTCTAENEDLYVDNTGNHNLIFDGFTKTLVAKAKVTPCQEYTLKLTIADVHDPLVDSGVFLASRSFSSKKFDVEAIGVGLDGTIVEGCSLADLVFSIPKPKAEDYTINLTKIGSATAGIDFTDFPNSVMIPAGDTVTSFTIEAFSDNAVEADDSIGIEIQIAPCLTEQIWIPIKDSQLDLPDLGADPTICLGDTFQLSGLSGTVGDTLRRFEALGINERIKEVQENRSNPINDEPSFFPIDVSGITPAEVVPNLINSICININHVRVGEVDIFLQAPSGKFIELSTDNGGQEDHYINTCFTLDAFRKIEDGTAPFTGLFLPEGNLENFYGEPVNGTWTLIVRDDDGTGGSGSIKGTMLNWSLNFNPDYQISYEWEQADNMSCVDCPNPLVYPTENTAYRLNAIDSYGCTAADSIKINIDEGLPAPLTDCKETTTSSVIIGWEPVVGARNYSVNINNGGWERSNRGDFEHEITGLSEGEIVDVQVRGNANGQCGAIAEMVTCAALTCIVPQPQLDSLSLITCNGEADGQIFLSADIDAYFVLGNDTSELGQTVQFQSLAADTYKVLVLSDSKECGDTLKVTIEEPTIVNAQIIDTEPLTCFGQKDGAITVAGSGGTGPYTYNWSNIDDTSLGFKDTTTLTDLAAGVYGIEIVDANNCSDQKFLTLASPKEMIKDSSFAGESCFQTGDGAASISIDNSFNNVAFVWSNGARTASLNNLSGGEYIVTVTNSFGCRESRSFMVETPPEIELREVESTSVSCPEKNDGTATALAKGGIGEFQYQWNDAMGQTGEVAAQLPANNYEVVAVDETGCSQTLAVTIPAIDPITLVNQVEAISCFGEADGTIELNISGGTPNYQIEWSDNQGQNDMERQNLSAGDYQVVITDVKDCSTTLDFAIGNKAPVELAITQDAASCNVADGSIAVGIITSGGNTNFSFQWSDDPNRTTARATDLAKGEYSITVTNVEGCEVTETVKLEEETGIQLTASATPVICAEEATGSASVVATGGSGAYLYLWDDPIAQQSPIASNLFPGDYMVLVLDNNGCERTTSVTVRDNSTPILIEFTKENIKCFGEENGRITTNIISGMDGLDFQWSNGATAADLANLSPDNYFLTVTDANGCSRMDTLEITAPEELFAETMVEPISCPGEGDGQISILPMGGTAPYQYSLNGRRFAFEGDYFNLPPGIYYPSIMDANNCTYPIEEVLMPDADPLTININNLQIKAGDTTQISPQIENGKGELTFIWSGNNLTDLSCTDCPEPILNATSSQLYKLMVLDEVGCEAKANIRVLVEKNRKIYVPTGFSPNSDGRNDRLTVHGVEGTKILSFKIFDRWGELVFASDTFQANDESAGWDGYFKGEPLSTNVFPWIAEVEFSDGVVETVKGHTTLIR